MCAPVGCSNRIPIIIIEKGFLPVPIGVHSWIGVGRKWHQQCQPEKAKQQTEIGNLLVSSFYGAPSEILGLFHTEQTVRIVKWLLSGYSASAAALFVIVILIHLGIFLVSVSYKFRLVAICFNFCAASFLCGTLVASSDCHCGDESANNLNIFGIALKIELYRGYTSIRRRWLGCSLFLFQVICQQWSCWRVYRYSRSGVPGCCFHTQRNPAANNAELVESGKKIEIRI